MKLKILELSDAEALLSFEHENQAWFEQFIPPREKSFYSLKGVAQHIREFQLDYKVGELIPMLILDEHDTIVGRVNLSNMGNKRAPIHLGYRVGQAFIGKGIATWAVSNALNLLDGTASRRIVAYAATDNPASQRVLLANQFTAIKCVHAFAELNGRTIDCIEYSRSVRISKDA